MGERMLNARLGDIVLEEVDEEVGLYKDLIVDAINIFIGVVVPDEIQTRAISSGEKPCAVKSSRAGAGPSSS